MKPGVICMAVHRPDPELIRSQLLSIQAQSLQDWVCMVGIDGRDALATALVREIVAHDERFQLIEFDHNVGFYRNFERLIAMSGEDAPWVALADQDDYWYPDKLAVLVDRLAYDNVHAVSAQARVVDSAGREIGRTRRRPVGLGAMLIDNQLTGSLAVMSGRLAALSLPFPPPTDAAYHDHWLGVLATALGRIEFLDSTLQDYVQHGSNVLGERASHTLFRRLIKNAKRRIGPRYLARERWNWRVTMATWAQLRLDSEHGVLSAFSDGHLSPWLIKHIVRAVWRREAPPGRSIALLIGAAFWRERDRCRCGQCAEVKIKPSL